MSVKIDLSKILVHRALVRGHNGYEVTAMRAIDRDAMEITVYESNFITVILDHDLAVTNDVIHEQIDTKIEEAIRLLRRARESEYEVKSK